MMGERDLIAWGEARRRRLLKDAGDTPKKEVRDDSPEAERQGDDGRAGGPSDAS